MKQVMRLPRPEGSIFMRRLLQNQPLKFARVRQELISTAPTHTHSFPSPF